MQRADGARCRTRMRARLWVCAALAAAVMVVCAGCMQQAQPSSTASVGDVSQSASDVSAPAAQQDPLEQKVQEKQASMTLEQKVAQLFIVRPEVLAGADDSNAVTEFDDATKAACARYPVGGVVLFAQNVVDPQQTKTLNEAYQAELQSAAGLPAFIGVDEEGGTVSRVALNAAFGIADVGNMSAIGATGDPARASAVGTTIAGYLRPYGFNVDFAPDADVYDPTIDDTMEWRSFGTDAPLVSDMVSAQVKAFNAAGMVCCVKHFPGHGSAVGNSDFEAVTCAKTIEQLRAKDLLPFQAAIAAGVPMVMVGHISCPNVTGDATPASFSKTFVTDELRNRMGFQGIIITDSLGMGALGSYSADQSAVAALQAGCDMLLMPSDLPTAYAGVIDAVRSGSISEARIDESVTRILRVKLSGTL